jgi:hypothetical protein
MNVTNIRTAIKWHYKLLKLGYALYFASLFDEDKAYNPLIQHINRIYSNLNKEECEEFLNEVFNREYPKAVAEFHKEKQRTADLIARYQFRAPWREEPAH